MDNFIGQTIEGIVTETRATQPARKLPTTPITQSETTEERETKLGSRTMVLVNYADVPVGTFMMRGAQRANVYFCLGNKSVNDDKYFAADYKVWIFQKNAA